jgi:Flp pilus assembly protein TadD
VAKGDLSGAMADFNQALKVDPRNAEAYVNRGLLLWQEGMKADAERDFARSIKVKPSLKEFIQKRISQITQN